MIETGVSTYKMRQTLILLTILSLVLISCSGINQKKELLTNYESTIEILINSIKQNGNIIERSRANYPEKTNIYYLKWKSVDSLTSEIETFLSNSSQSQPTIDFYKTTKGEIDNIQKNYYDFIDSTWSKNYKQTRNKLDKKLAEQLQYPLTAEVEGSTFPKLFACSILLKNLQHLTKSILTNISSSECFWSIPWSTSGNIHKDTTLIAINSNHFYDLTQDGFFKIKEISNSLGQKVHHFDSRKNTTIWTVKFAGHQDSVYYLTGSIFTTHPVSGMVKEIDTFENKKIVISTSNR